MVYRTACAWLCSLRRRVCRARAFSSGVDFRLFCSPSAHLAAQSLYVGRDESVDGGRQQDLGGSVDLIPLS